MTEAAFYQNAIIAWLALSALVCPILFFIPAPYGRHTAGGWGPLVKARWGWWLMELPAVITIAVCFILSPPAGPVPWLFLALWQVHYVHRAIIFPMRLDKNAKPIPLSVALMGATFNVGNGYFNGRWLTVFGRYDMDWLTDPRFLVGVALFAAGYVINMQSDAILLRLRRNNTGYQIPHGAMFRWVSCPNYFGEVLEWSGWALATWSLPGAAFALWTLANLMPRAVAHHKWYQRTFSDYPRERRAFLPGVF